MSALNGRLGVVALRVNASPAPAENVSVPTPLVKVPMVGSLPTPGAPGDYVLRIRLRAGTSDGRLLTIDSGPVAVKVVAGKEQ